MQPYLTRVQELRGGEGGLRHRRWGKFIEMGIGVVFAPNGLPRSR